MLVMLDNFMYFRGHKTCGNVCICSLTKRKPTLSVRHWIFLYPLQGHGWEHQTPRVISDVNCFSIWVSERLMRQFKMPLDVFAHRPDVSHLTWSWGWGWRDGYLWCIHPLCPGLKSIINGERTTSKGLLDQSESSQVCISPFTWGSVSGKKDIGRI